MRTCTTFMRIFKLCARIPRLSKAGWLRHQIKPRSLLRGADGAVSNFVDNHPVRFANTPPWKGGECRLNLARPAAFIACAALCCISLIAQTPTDSWPTYHGDYSGQRHSPLSEITPENINRLAKVWTFQTGQNQQIKATPVLVSGVIYISTPDNLWAVDAHDGKQLWHYTAPENKAFHIGHRGVAVYKDNVYLTTPDAHLIALNAQDGKVRWNVVV